MSLSVFFIILLFLGILSFAACIGCLLLFQSVAKNAKKYQEFIRKLQEQGKYEEWAYRHKYSVMFEKIYQHRIASIIVFVLMAFLIGFLIELPSVPKVFLAILYVVAFVYWPFVFIVMLTVSTLYKKSLD